MVASECRTKLVEIIAPLHLGIFALKVFCLIANQGESRLIKVTGDRVGRPRLRCAMARGRTSTWQLDPGSGGGRHGHGEMGAACGFRTSEGFYLYEHDGAGESGGGPPHSKTLRAGWSVRRAASVPGLRWLWHRLGAGEGGGWVGGVLCGRKRCRRCALPPQSKNIAFVCGGFWDVRSVMVRAGFSRGAKNGTRGGAVPIGGLPNTV
jgi:hypothetical protein